MYNAVYPVPGKETSLPFYLSGIGRTSPEFHIKRNNGLISHQLLFTANGAGILLVNGRKYALGMNSLLYLPPALAHEYYPENGEWSTFWMVFRGSGLDGIMQSMGFRREMIAYNADLSAFAKLYNRISRLAADNFCSSEKCSLLIYESVLMARSIFDGTNSADSTGNEIVDTALRYISEHYSADISLNDLSGLSGISPQYFGRLFKERMNMRPMEYVARVKIARAKTMLLNSDMLIAEIAGRLGFSSNTYFGIVFKKYEGLSPTEFRKNCGSII